ncbi:MAG TPA: hypothetical protein VND97_00925 [Beijerinckiaceae bacterium]|nr:hypothetical protein [Beijerinckiaceae bacterium]
MKITAPLLLLVFLAATMTEASAQSRPYVPGMSCAQAKALVRSAGAIVLSTGRYTYDRYVAGDGYCLPEDMTAPAFERTRDNRSCFIGYYCTPRRGMFR